MINVLFDREVEGHVVEERKLPVGTITHCIRCVLLILGVLTHTAFVAKTWNISICYFFFRSYHLLHYALFYIFLLLMYCLLENNKSTWKNPTLTFSFSCAFFKKIIFMDNAQHFMLQLCLGSMSSLPPTSCVT